MRTTLVYLDVLEESRKGTIRGLMGTFTLGAITVPLAWYCLPPPRRLITMVIVILMTIVWSSALSVQEPQQWKEAIGYGALVGLVIGSALLTGAFLAAPQRGTRFLRATILLAMILMSTVSSVILYAIFWDT